jgi:hypothetical protein
MNRYGLISFWEIAALPERVSSDIQIAITIAKTSI